MFRLTTETFPTTHAELAAAVRGALAESFALPDGPELVSAEGDWPAGEALRIDLTGARLTDDRPPADATADAEPGPTYETFSLTADPLHVDAAAVYLRLTAESVAFALDHAEDGNARLLLTSADHGHVSARVAKADLLALLLDRARQATAAHKVTIDSADLSLASDGPRSVAVSATVVAHKKLFIASAGGTFHFAGRLDVDDELMATLGDLTCTGEGIIASAAAPVMTAKLAEFNGRQFPLAAVSLGDVRLRDVSITTGEDLTVTAAFGRR